MGLNIPLVPATDGIDRKLYLQLIFSVFFIEQKKGWSSIYSGMPYLGIRDSKRRVTEYILGLSCFENSRRKMKILNQEKYCKEKWKDLYGEFLSLQRMHQCSVIGISAIPERVNSDDRIRIVSSCENGVTVDEWIDNLREKQSKLMTRKPKIRDNFKEIEKELYRTEDNIEDIISKEKELVGKIILLKRKIKRIEDSLKVLEEDIQNNEDVKKLSKLGSRHHCNIFSGVCPTCHKEIKDTLLDFQQDVSVMGVDETIKHLKAQKELVIFAKMNYENNLMDLKNDLVHVRDEKNLLLRKARAIRNDLYSIDDDYSEMIINKRIELENKIESLKSFVSKSAIYLEKFDKLYKEWEMISIEKAKCGKDFMSKEDKNILKTFGKNFVNNLRTYNYYSTHSIDKIEISEDGYMPVIDRFDMKFDSSASDNIRAVWAYTIALTQTSDQYKKEKPGIMIFDEPAQHSIGAADLKAFLASIIKLKEGNQTFVGITLNNQNVQDAVEDLPKEMYKMIHLKGRAFKRKK